MYRRFGFGGGPIGTFGREVTDAEANEALAVAWNLGVRHFDTAPWYGMGLSERRMGTFLGAKPRDGYVLSTKVGRILRPSENEASYARTHGPWVSPLPFEVEFDYSAEGITRSYEDSLQRLGLSRVDHLVVHDLDRSYHGEQFEVYLRQLLTSGFEALRDMKSKGVVSAIGVGINELGLVARFLELFPTLDFVLYAGPYTLLAAEDALGELGQCEEAGVWVVMASAFRSGALLKGRRATEAWRQLSKQELERRAVVQEVCDYFRVPLAAAAMQFPLSHPTARTLLVGSASGRQVEENLSWLKADIPLEFWWSLVDRAVLPADVITYFTN